MTLELKADTSNTDESYTPTLLFSQDGGACELRIGMRELNNAAFIAWDDVGNGASQFLIISCGGTLQTYLSSSSTAWVTTSDARLKNVLGPVQDACSKLQRITPVYFEYKADAAKTRHLGLLAQEVELIAPEIVSEGPDGFLGMAYADLVPLLLQAINELTTRIAALESFILASGQNKLEQTQSTRRSAR